MDVDPHTLNLDPTAVTRKVREAGVPGLRAIMPVHLYGQCADMDAFRALGTEFQLIVIEDAAQAFGASWNGARAGTLGDAAAFSFYPTKNLSAFGDAGCLTTNHAALADRTAMLRNHGSVQRYRHEEIGGNSRLDELQAAVLRIKLKYVESWNHARRARAAAYDRLFAASGLLAPDAAAAPSAGAPVRLLRTAPQAFHIYHQYVVRVPQRDALRGFLAERGVSTEVYYPIPLHLQPCFAFLGYHTADLPVAEAAAREVLALPMFPELTDEEQQYVVDAIADFYS
jgi:dTDP-4-amino-4,6-dideoxygalactose transaminase